MKRLLRLAAIPALAIALALGAAAHAIAAEAIQSFVSDVHLAKDGELTVTETIRVNAEGREIRHGIYRDFPLFFQDAKGDVHEVTFDLLGVMRDGKPEPYFTKRINNAVRIYAGDKDTYVRHGEHTYVFRYRTGRQVRWFNGRAELNWNVTGNFWRFPILSATYHLQLVDNARPERFIAFTGRMGARGHDWQGGLADDGMLTIQTTKRLGPHEGLTVVAALPPAAISPPTRSQLFWWSLRDNRRWIFAGVGFLLVLGYYYIAWRAVGRDPKRGTIIPLFHPPEGISPALANYIHRWGFGREKWRAFTAAALSLGVRGLIQLDDSDKSLTLKVLGKEPEGGADKLPPGERAIYDWVKEQGGTAKIDRANGAQVASVGSDFTSSIESESKNRFFKRNIGFVIVGLFLTIFVVFGTIVLGGLQDTDMFILGAFAFGGAMVGGFGVPLLTTIFGGHGFQRIVSILALVFVVGILFSLASNFVVFFFPHGGGSVLPTIVKFLEAYPFSPVLVTSFAAINGLFLYLMRAPTELGRPIMDQLEGFKLYMETAEKDRLNMQAPELTTQHFEALLPYAVALDVEKPWADAFAAALARSHPGDSDPMGHYYRPTWHTGQSWSGANFGTAIGATVAGATAALVSSVPVSSGSSGFSGGGGGGSGGGGGGGGGW